MALTPQEKAAIKAELERRKAAASKPETYVTDEQYAELESLYNAAKKSAAGNPNKKTPETLAFQKRYHELLPDEAHRIIASSKKATTKGESLPLEKQHSLEANEDAMFGSRTEQYWQTVKKKPVEEAKPEGDVALTDTDPVKDEERKPFETNTPVNQKLPGGSPWWLQDIIKTAGAAYDLANIKRYMPWQATPQVRLPEATFYDPTREIAAANEAANMAMQNSQAFTNPQQQAAANTVAQGQLARTVADTMGRYNNQNVQTANQLSQEQASILNQASQNKAKLDTELWDKYTILNQQFDNSKAMARQNLRQSFMDAITNRANTYNLNQLYPQYAINPMDGGKMYFRPDYNKIKPTTSQADLDNQYAHALKLTGDPDRALKLMQLQSKGSLPDENPQNYLNGYPGKNS